MALTPGLLLSNRYRLTSRIAVGGMGEVWAADDTRLGREIAVKILKSELTSDPEFVDRFRTEARITASLNHSGIAAVYDYGEVASIAGGPKDTAFLVMELVAGEPLSAVLARQPRISVPRTLDVLEQTGRALQAAHNLSLVHRDIKPGNIMITPAGVVKVTDFGIAKAAYQVPITKGGMVMGTAQYLSPEQAAGHEAVPASDVYALGVVAYECLAGTRPFNGEHPIAVAMAQVNNPPPALPLDIPPPVTALVMRMLAKDPRQRFDDGATLADAVAAVRTGKGVAAIGVHPTHAVPAAQAAQAAQAARAVQAAQARAGAGYSPIQVLVGPRPVRRTGLAWLLSLLILLISIAAGVYLASVAGGDSVGDISDASTAMVPAQVQDLGQWSGSGGTSIAETGAGARWMGMQSVVSVAVSVAVSVDEAR
ncbi:serine/threonine-protein kinase [Nakamurella lactea]|uniref:serine/threonine-protein kinase n=1 Tax=Nakamurella lactea TaxID=459515 RepID=UPI0003FEE8E9|nr:serine/threonine-protein kinase [Nakamurella lactea]